MTETNVILMPVETEAIKEAKEGARSLCEHALTIKVDCVESFNKSADIRTMLNTAKKKVSGTFSNMLEAVKRSKQAAEEARKTAVNLHGKAIAPFEVADEHIKQQRLAFTREQERLRQIEETKAREKAEREAEKERDKLRKQALAAEEKARKLAEAGKAEQAQRMAEKAKEKVDQVQDVYVKPVAVASEVDRKTKTDTGTVYNKTDIVIHLPETEADIKAFCQGVLDDTWTTTCVKFSLANIKSHAKNTGRIGRFDGIIIEEKIDEIVR